MGNINRIDIYVGEVGTAYVDKETALKKLNAALKDTNDMNQIKEAAEEAKLNAENAKENAQAALNGAEAVKALLQDKINELSELSPSNPKYELLTVLLRELNLNDNDGIGLNGGNIVTATNNIEELDRQITEAAAIIEEVNSYLNSSETIDNLIDGIIEDMEQHDIEAAENKLATLEEHLDSEKTNEYPGRLINIIIQYLKEYVEALDTFKGFLPEETENEENENEQIEQSLTERVNAVNAAVDNANAITDAINVTSQDTTARIEEIVNEDEPEPEPQTTYTVNLVIENGYTSSSQSQTVNTGEFVEWTVVANDGYKLPTSVDNGTIDGNIVRSVEVHENMTVTVTCEQNEVEPEPVDEIFMYIGTERPTVLNANTLSSNAILYETTKPEWTVNSKGSLNVTTKDLYWMALPVSWGNVTIQYGAFPTSQANMDDDTGEVFENIMVNNVEYIIRRFVLGTYPFEIWF